MSLFNFFKKKNKITILSENWEVLYDNINFKTIPRENEYIYDDKSEIYLIIIKVIHPINNKNNICIVVKKLTDEINNNLQ